MLTYDEINRSWLEDFDAFMAKEGLSRNTRTSRMLCVAAVFNLAIDNEQTKNTLSAGIAFGLRQRKSGTCLLKKSVLSSKLVVMSWSICSC